MVIESEYPFFGEFIAKCRDRQGLSQEDLARLLDLSRVSIANIEGGRQRVLLHQVLQFAKVLKFSLSDFQAEADRSKLEQEIRGRSISVQAQLNGVLSKKSETG